MTQAVPYKKANNFTQYATNNPAAPYPPAQLDSELNAVALFSANIQNNLAKIQNDNGGLTDGVVMPTNFSAEALELMASVDPLKIKGQWVTATPYAKNDVFTNAGTVYFVATAHTSGVFATDFTANRFMQIGASFLTGIAANILYAVTGGIITGANVQAALVQVQGFIAALQTLTVAHTASIATNSTAIAQLNTDIGTLTTYINSALATKEDVAVMPRMIAHKSTTAQSIANVTDTKVLFQTVDVDTLAAYDNVLSRYFYASPEILLMARVSWTTAAGGYISIKKNGLMLVTHDFSSNLTWALQVPMTIEVGDYIEVWVRQSSGAAIALSPTARTTMFAVIGLRS